MSGYLEIVGEHKCDLPSGGAKCHIPKDTYIAMRKTNEARQNVYESIAEKRNMTTFEIARLIGKKNVKKAKPGEMVRFADVHTYKSVTNPSTGKVESELVGTKPGQWRRIP